MPATVAPPPSLAEVAREAESLGKASHPKGDRPDFAYGTAGFRTAAEGLDHVMFRMGILAAIRSKALGGQAVGVMVTASHNPVQDNGAKLVEPMGEMLPLEWEAHATKIANVSDDGLAAAIAEIIGAVGADPAAHAEVVVGRDSRPSSPGLALAVCDGVGVLRPASSRSLGLTTTPQLHYVVRCEATAGGYGAPSLTGYGDKLVDAFEKLLATGSGGELAKYRPRVVVDCANGVGAVATRPLLDRLKAIGLEADLANTGEGVLNQGCGADFVKMKQCQPSGVDTTQVRGLSFDGDADRILYYFGGDGAGFHLLDGDRIALLLAHLVARLLKKVLDYEVPPEDDIAGETTLRLGLVQTAYANGASTARAVEALGAENVLCAKTGVKHCHHAALALDVGIYFEANGHGTVLFSKAFVDRTTAASRSQDAATAAAAKQLLLLRDLINEAVGDAISIFLAVEAVLRLLDWSCEEWLAMYADLPNRQVKVVVADRGAFETTDAERKCVRPAGLQDKVDALAAKYPSGRCFVRPSGTEDVVRVYAEAASESDMIALAQAVVDLVYDTAGGKGDRPKVA